MPLICLWCGLRIDGMPIAYSWERYAHVLCHEHAKAKAERQTASTRTLPVMVQQLNQLSMTNPGIPGFRD